MTTDDLTALTILYAAGQQISNLSGLEYATNLTTLSLPDNAITDASVLAGLGNLLSIDLQGNHLGDAHSLAGLSQLQTLNISDNAVQDAAPLLALTNLGVLMISGNPLTNAAAMGGLTNLTTLYAASCAPTNMEFVGNLIRPSTAAHLQFSVTDDVTLADRVSVAVTCSGTGPLSNSTITLVRTSIYISPSPAPPIVLPPIPIRPPIPGPRPLDVTPGLPVGIIPYGGGVSDRDLTVTPPLNQTGTMTLTLTATDDTGLSTEATILVTVVPPQVLDGVWLEATDLAWQTSGNAVWFGQTNISHSGSAAAQMSVE